MDLQQFIKKYNGKQVEVAGSANAINQCTDLCNAYLRDVWGLPIVEWTNAVDFPEKINCEFITNTLDGVPQPGDIIVFKKYGSLYGSAGHIGVVTEATVNLIRIFEQNYPTGSACKIGVHNYLGCRGWLRKKSMTDEISIKKAVFENLVSKSSRFDEYAKAGYESATQVTQLLSELRKSIDEKNSAIDAEKARAENFRTDYLARIAKDAIALGVQQEENQIDVALAKIKEQLIELEDLTRNFATLQLSSGEEKEALNAEIARLNALLQQKDVLANVAVADLLRELIKRLLSIVKRK